ncbi:STAS domain-containing protein [Streptomyces sp. NPDC017638]|uniref:STAS domain-containing protein n=1 Tax=Streptomyces sp. NPDC017638 TaxID=3365004 RepID=UPI00379470B1
MAETFTRSACRHTERAVGGTTVVQLYGEIDFFTPPPLAERLDELTAVSRPGLVVDLRAVSFIDCAGLRLLCQARTRAAERHGRLLLVADGGQFRRLLRAAGLDRVFEIYDRLPEALAALTARPGTLGTGRPDQSESRRR